MLTISSRSFQRVTVSLCRSKGCKVMGYQTLRMIQSFRTWPNHYIDSTQETDSILKIGFALSKWPHFNIAYVLGVFTTFSANVLDDFKLLSNYLINLQIFLPSGKIIRFVHSFSLIQVDLWNNNYLRHYAWN